MCGKCKKGTADEANVERLMQFYNKIEEEMFPDVGSSEKRHLSDDDDDQQRKSTREA